MKDHPTRDLRGWAGRLISVGLLCALSLFTSSAGAIEPPTNLRIGTPSPPPPAPPPPTAGSMPLSWAAPAFANVTNSGPLNLSGGVVRSNLSITQNGSIASVCCGSFTLNNVRISSAEGVRAGGGDINLNWVWVEAKGVSGDHADALQCYGPGSTGVITVKNSTFRAYNNDATAGYFAADNWKGSHRFENVLFWGGPFGLRINADGGTAAYLKNVYFVKDSFRWSPLLIEVPILQWENVRWATIQNGQLVPGDAIPRP